MPMHVATFGDKGSHREQAFEVSMPTRKAIAKSEPRDYIATERLKSSNLNSISLSNLEESVQWKVLIGVSIALASHSAALSIYPVIVLPVMHLKLYNTSSWQMPRCSEGASAADRRKQCSGKVVFTPGHLANLH